VNCGWGIVEARGNALRHVASGTIRAGRGVFSDRLVTIYDEIRALITAHSPSEGAIEGIFHQRNAQSALKLGHARGVALVAMVHADLTVTEYEPSRVKKAVLGRGNATKEQVQAMVSMLLGRPSLQTLDESDALAIAICHLQRLPSLNRSPL
jgi:crossover junction endodeoxyribonuclease RuvC